MAVKHIATLAATAALAIGGLAATAPDADAARFVNDKTSTRSVYALKSKHGFVYTVHPGEKAPKGTKYVRVLRNNEAKYWGWDARAHPTLKSYQGPTTKRQKVKRHFYVDFHRSNVAAQSNFQAASAAGVAPASNYGGFMLA